MEEANNAGNNHKLYKILNKCTGTSNITSEVMKYSDGPVASKHEDQM